MLQHVQFQRTLVRKFQLSVDVLVYLMKLDAFEFLNFGKLDTTSLEAINATTWVKRQFAAWHLHPDIKSVKPYDGLDTMLLFSWVLTKFSQLDNQPFVLHYADLRMPNIIIDKGNNMVG